MTTTTTTPAPPPATTPTSSGGWAELLAGLRARLATAEAAAAAGPVDRGLALKAARGDMEAGGRWAKEFERLRRDRDLLARAVHDCEMELHRGEQAEASQIRAERLATVAMEAGERIGEAEAVDAAAVAYDAAIERWWRRGDRLIPYEDLTGRGADVIQRKAAITDALFAVGGGALAREILDLRLPSVKQPLAEYERALWAPLLRRRQTP